MIGASQVADDAQGIEAALGAQWRRWFRVEVFPFWRQTGFLANGLACERLDLTGRPDPAAILRVRTQARQVHSFALAARLGLDAAGLARARRTLDVLVARAWSPDGRPGWVHTLHPDGSVADARRDLYDHAFVLLMLATMMQAAPSSTLRAWIETAVAEIDTLFQAPHGGFAESDTGGLPRRQNPHMHLLEAFLALFEATGEPRFLARAGELFGLFRTRFFDEEAGVLREFFDAAWGRLPDGRSDRLEPGHLAEWVWLLDRYERLGGRPTAVLRARLLDAARRLGRDPTAVFLLDEIDPAGNDIGGFRRLWPQTEYLKALVVQARRGEPRHWGEAATVSAHLVATYLADVPSGTWRDRFTTAGAPAVDHVPASTLYHLLGVLAELAASSPAAAAVCPR